jgi:hypothetical protein
VTIGKVTSEKLEERKTEKKKHCFFLPVYLAAMAASAEMGVGWQKKGKQ